MSCLSATLTNAVFAYFCICVFVFVYLQVRHPGTLFLRSSYHYLFKNIADVIFICNFDQCCICVFVYLQVRHPGTLFLRSSYHYLFQKYSTCHVYLQHWPMLYMRICVFVYLKVRLPGTLFLRPSYHYLFKNIANVMSICNFDQCCICVFVYLCICKSDTREHCFWGPLNITFSKI